MIHLLVDYENVHYSGLEGTEYLTPEDTLTIFYSKPCRYIPQYRMKHILDSGCKFEICELVSKRKNALDFYIASKVGEIFAEDRNANVAIVSKDNGFKSVRDYWNVRLNPSSRLVKNDTITSCIISSAEPYQRRINLQQNTSRVELIRALQIYTENEKTVRIKKQLCDTFENTEYEKLIPQIVDIVEGSNDLKNMYISSLKTFGKEKGLGVYRQLKQVV